MDRDNNRRCCRCSRDVANKAAPTRSVGSHGPGARTSHPSGRYSTRHADRARWRRSHATSYRPERLHGIVPCSRRHGFVLLGGERSRCTFCTPMLAAAARRGFVQRHSPLRHLWDIRRLWASTARNGSAMAPIGWARRRGRAMRIPDQDPSTASTPRPETGTPTPRLHPRTVPPPTLSRNAVLHPCRSTGGEGGSAPSSKLAPSVAS